MNTTFGIVTRIADSDPRFNGNAVDLSRFPDVPTETMIEAVFDGNTLIDWQYDLNSWPEREKIPFHIAVAWNDDRHDADEFLKEAHDRLVQICQNRWDIKIKVYDVAGIDLGGWDLTTFDYRKFAQIVREDGFEATHYVFVGGWGTDNCGRARAGGNKAMARPNCGSETFVHELLHNGANRHVHVIHSGIPGDVYGEIGVLQARSTGGARDDISTPHLFQMQLIEENNIKELPHGESGTFFLVQGSADPLSLAAGEDKAVMCMRAGPVRRLMVSYHDGTVRVHRPGYDYSTLFRQTTMLHRLDKDESAVIDGEVYVRFLGEENGAAKVAVNNGDARSQPLPPEVFSRWVAPENAVPLDANLNGLWNNPAWSGSGHGVQTRYNPQTGMFVLHWFGWSRLGYKPEYRWMVVPATGGAAEGVLYRNEDGEEVESGRGFAFWRDRWQGIFRAYDEKLGRFAMPLSRLGVGREHAYNGYFGLGNGEGLSVSALNDGQMVAFWLLTDGGWRLVQGPLGSMTVYGVSGGMLCTNVQIEKRGIGTASIGQGVFLNTLGSDKTMQQLA